MQYKIKTILVFYILFFCLQYSLKPSTYKYKTKFTVI